MVCWCHLLLRQRLERPWRRHSLQESQWSQHVMLRYPHFQSPKVCRCESCLQVVRWTRKGHLPTRTDLQLCHVGVSENSVPLNPMVNDHYPVFKWLFHWEYTQHFQTNPCVAMLWSIGPKISNHIKPSQLPRPNFSLKHLPNFDNPNCPGFLTPKLPL